jgi:uncharacterized membrane protein (UPF0182 family)
MKRGPVVLGGLIAALIVVLLSVPALIRLLTDWYWFDALQFDTVFFTTLKAKIGLGVGAAVLSFGYFFANLTLAQRGMVPDPIVVKLSPNVPRLDVTRALRRVTWPVSIVLSLLVGMSASTAWLDMLRFFNAAPFGVTDPVFGRDIGYYFFTLPALAGALNFVIGLTILVLFMVVPLYFIRGDVAVARRRITIEPSTQLHLGMLVAVMFVAVALNTLLVRLPSLLYSTAGPLFGASYTDLVVRIPLLHASWVVAIAGAVAVLVGARMRQLARNTAFAVIAYFIVAGIAGSLIPAAVQKFVVDPNELAKEQEQLTRHIAATREAWALESVSVRDLTGESTLTLEDIQANAGTMNNVRLWDRAPLLQTFRQLQEIRTYYDFVSVDDDRYWIDGEYRQVLLSPRELNTASLPTRNFINERLTYTHGMGLTLSPVNQVSPQGLPELFIKDLPPISTVSLQITQPAIYFGELSNDFAFVATDQPEFDFPLGDSSAFTSYAGEGGVDVSSFVRRLALSARFGSMDAFLTEYVSQDSKVLYHRNIRERAAKALPFLRWDGDPYMMISEDGRLKWILDAYTSSRSYPYSQPLSDGTNYMRNSVKVIIDAYDGDLKAYIVDAEDPIIQTYASIFPGILLPVSDMPADIRAHIRYPEDLFRAQAGLYTTYHMDEAEIFYAREDQWQIPALGRGEGTRDPYLRHIVMKLPGESREEYIMMTPFTPRQKDNLAAWMVARNDGDSYGQLVVYRFPRQSLVFGPSQILNRINQDTEVSQQLTLWDQRGSEVIRGNLLVIPIEESLIFVQAIYLRAEGGQIPELKRVVVAYQNRVVMEETLDRGLIRLFGGTAGEPTVASVEPTVVEQPLMGTGVADLLQQAAEHYDRAMAAQRAGDWSTYGEEIGRVGDLLQRARQLAGGASF